MRHRPHFILCVGAALALAACENPEKAEVERAMETVNAIDDSNLSDLMLSTSSPQEGVTYFTRASQEQPDRIDLKRGLAISLVRAKEAERAIPVWNDVIAMEGSTADDKVGLADAEIRAGRWDEAEETLNSVPPTYESFKRYRLEAMVADSNQKWSEADSFYEVAVGLTTNPSGVYNNWGYSKLTRGDYAGAEKMFSQALIYDPDLFTAKNNIALARGAQRNYTLPVIPMSQTERAQLLHTLGLAAVKQGDIVTGKGLLKEAVDSHPQHFEAAARSLAALEDNVTN
ncbi:MAG: tetratricopeptide repeat protein [Pseudomonadota bacterium]